MSHPSLHTLSAQERRRFTRIPVLQRALLTVNGSKPFPGEIRDFCQGGLFLRLDRRHTQTQWDGQAIEIKFAASHRPGRPILKLEGLIVRVGEQGLGIAFAQPDASEALEALREIAQVSAPTHPTMPHPDIERGCQDALEHLIPDLMRYFSAHILDDLLDAADRATTGTDQTAYFDAVTLFKAPEAQVEHFRTQALSQARNYTIVTEPELAQRESYSLSLMEQGLFEDWLNLIAETTRQDTVFEGQLRILEQRLSQLAPHPIDAKNNPYGPLALGRAFRKAIEPLPLSNAARSIAYKTLGHALQHNLGGFYRQLIDLTAPLHIEQAPRRIRSGERPIAPLAPMTPAAAPVGATPGPDLASMFASLNQLYTSSKPGNGKQGDWSAALNFASDIFQDRLQPAQVNTLHLLGAVLANLRNDPATPVGLHPFLKQWQMPLLKLAIRDPELLNQPEHPARRFLDALDEIALAVDSRGQIEEPLSRPLREWTERLNREGARDPTLLEQAANALRTLTAPLLQARNNRIQRLRKVYESQQRIEHARQRVNAEIELRCAGMVLPKVLPELLDLGWREWLILMFLRSGGTDTEWRESLKVVDNLLIWLGPGGRPPDPVLSYRTLEFIEERLRSVSLDIAACRRWIDTLTSLLILGQRPEWTDPQESNVPSLDAPGPKPELPARIRGFRVGDWLRSAPHADAPAIPLLLIWIGEGGDRFVFADRQGRKSLELDAQEFERSLQEGRMTRDEGFELPLSERIVGGLIQNVQEHLRYQVYYDAATGLLNHKGFLGWLNREFSEQRNSSTRHTLCMIEIEQVRGITGLCGHDETDRLLRELAELCKEALGGDTLLSRCGDHRFVALFRDCDKRQGQLKAEKLVSALGRYRFNWENRRFGLSAHIGLVAFRIDYETATGVFKRADTACLRAKEPGANPIQIYTEDDPALSAQEQSIDWAGRIDSFLADKRLRLRAQKIIPLSPDDTEEHYEILLGIHDNDNRLLPAAEIIAAAERWNRIIDIDRAQIKGVFEWIRREPARFEALGGLSVNLSGQSVNSEEFMDFLHQRLAQANWPLHKLTFEITETAAITQFGQAERFIHRMRRHGCKFALDDFGSGFASYAYLKNLKVDYLKIDGVFIRDLATSEVDYAMVKSMHEVARSLGIKTIAEFVESAEILDRLRQIGVDYGQGYYIGKPFLLNQLP